MSLSLNKFFAVKPSLMAGIAIGRNQLCAAVVDPKKSRNNVQGITRHILSGALFEGQPSAAIEAELAAALQAISVDFRAKFASVHVALPDTVIRSTVFEFDELPKEAEMRDSLLRWRFSREWQRPEDSLECRGFDLGSDLGKRLLFAQAGDKAWIDCIRRALTRADISPWSLNSASSYRFNHFHNVLTVGEGALLSLDSDCWNLLVWDHAARIRRVFTRLRDKSSVEDEMNMIIDETERAIHGNMRKAAGKVYLAGDAAETDLLAKQLEQRLQMQVVSLCIDTEKTENIAGTKEGMAPLAIAAALNI